MQIKTFAPAIIITLIGFFIAGQFVNPAPPRTITIATGHPGGAYHLFAERYQPLLAAEGITLEILDTAGSVENIRLLEDEAATIDLAFVQGGSTAGRPAVDLVSLGSLYFEPLWVFYRGTSRLERLTDLHGKRVAIGEPGSGTRAVAVTLLEDNFIDTNAGKNFPIGDQAAVDALLAGRVDAAFFVASAQSPLVQSLQHRQDIHLMSFSRATAYARLHPFLSSITLPEGIINLEANIPPEDTTLLAPTANLVAHGNFHPALVSLLLQTAARVHGSGSLFARPGEFPNDQNLVFQLDDDARRYYKHGTPFLQRYLPFWTANLLDRLKVMLVPLLTLLIPLAKIMPPTYRWQVRKKIYRWYRELKALDTEHPEQASTESLRTSLKQLEALEEEVRKVNVPLSYSDELYTLRLHIGLVRTRFTNAL
ncbi:MAG: TAXI family TRAP transporter solute-binding subunit [Gammaproteobacteria bacterium]|nr:TAXI family TRAP transporter solute-binding subunit [Gammaproteobacteria bacterium]